LTLRSSHTSVPQAPVLSRRAKPVMLAIMLAFVAGDIKRQQV
jgi:hypothetical protein